MNAWQGLGMRFVVLFSVSSWAIWEFAAVVLPVMGYATMMATWCAVWPEKIVVTHLPILSREDFLIVEVVLSITSIPVPPGLYVCATLLIEVLPVKRDCW